MKEDQRERCLDNWSYYSVWMSVLETAENKRDEELLRRIRGFDFFACEASFHSSCRRQYPRIPTQMKKTREGRRTLKSYIGKPSRNFVMLLKRKIIQGQRIMKLSDSCETYVSALEDTKHSKPAYKAEKLKKEVREKWHLRAYTAILFTEQWRED